MVFELEDRDCDWEEDLDREADFREVLRDDDFRDDFIEDEFDFDEDRDLTLFEDDFSDELLEVRLWIDLVFSSLKIES